MDALLQTAAAAASTAPTALPLREWVRRAATSVPSKEKYLESAVDVALELANCLCLVVERGGNQASSSSFSSLNHDYFCIAANGGDGGERINKNVATPSASLLQVQLEDIVPEAVVVNIKLADSLMTVESVEFSLHEQRGRDIFDFDAPELASRDVCAALGRIFFELFSRGEPLFLLERDASETKNENSQSSSLHSSFGDLVLENLDGVNEYDKSMSFKDLFLKDEKKDEKNGSSQSFRALFSDKERRAENGQSSRSSFQDLFGDGKQKVENGQSSQSTFRDLFSVDEKKGTNKDWCSDDDSDPFGDMLAEMDDQSAGGDSNHRKRSKSRPEGQEVVSSQANKKSLSEHKDECQSLPTRAKAHLQERGLPLSISRLVSDLLEAAKILRNEEFAMDSALTDLEETRVDLMHMKAHPYRFLHDRTDPLRAWEDTGLFNGLTSDLLETAEKEKSERGATASSIATKPKEGGVDPLRARVHPEMFLLDGEGPLEKTKERTSDDNLYGRKEEVSALLEMAKRVATHVSSPSATDLTTQENRFLCEAAFVSGHSGSGKSSIIKRVLSSCDPQWFVLACKFDRQTPPLKTIAKSFDDFFDVLLRSSALRGRHDIRLRASLDRVTRSVADALDSDGLGRLCELCPAFVKLFPLMGSTLMMNDCVCTTNVGSGRNRLHYLFQMVILSIVFEGGHPVLMIFDDLQWSDGLALDVVSDVIQAVASSNDGQAAARNESQGLFLIGTYRDNEVDTSIPRRVGEMEQIAGSVKVTQLSIGELSRQDIGMMLSFKLGMLIRCTKDLSSIILTKTRGNPMFVLSFLRSIISKDILSFSMRSRSWEWDDCTLDALSISEDVAEFVARGLSRLDGEVLVACQICSCIGFQVEKTTLELMNLGQFVPDLLEALDTAAKEGILDVAGPVYAFSHDMLRESAYATIPEDERHPLHKLIAWSLVQDPAVTEKAELCSLAVDQINICKDVDGILNPIERARFARFNLQAGHHAIKSSSFEQAKRYFEAGISLLHANHFEKQYELSLELYEMICVVSFMDGTLENVSTFLDAILSNAKSFQDTWKAKELEIKMLASRGQYVKSTTKCLTALSEFGIHFPNDINLPIVTNEIAGTSALLKDVTKDFLLNLPPMLDASRLCAMKFMSILCHVTLFANPMVCHMASALMLKEALLYGFFEETIYSLANFSRALVHITQEYVEANRIGLLAQSFLVGHKNEHTLRVRFPLLIHVSAGVLWEPGQSIPVHCMNGYQSGMIVGDTENAMMCGFLVCQSRFHTSYELSALQETACNFIRQMVKHNQIGVMNQTMCIFETCAALTGSRSKKNSLEIKTIRELTVIANQTKNFFLLHHIYLSRMFVHFYFREYIQLLEIAEAHKVIKVKRIMNFLRVYFVGISSLSLARDTRQEKWRKIGDEAVETFTSLVNFSRHNFEKNLFLLQAELHYLNGNLRAAQVAYEDSIESARTHKFKNDEAFAHELYGIFLIENKMFERGMVHLNTSLSRYRDWGADVKAKSLISFMEHLFTAKTTWNVKYKQIL